MQLLSTSPFTHILPPPSLFLRRPLSHLLCNPTSQTLFLWRKKGTRTSARCQANHRNHAEEKVPFGYSRKDVLLIGLGVTIFGVGLKYSLEWFGLDPLKAGNVVQILLVLGLTLGWVSTYIWRVSTKEMTYAKQLRDYETEVMKKRLEELPEAELEYMLAQVEEEKRRLQLTESQVSE